MGDSGFYLLGSLRIVPFQLDRLNEGGGVDLALGVFTAPVLGINHLDFTGLKDRIPLFVEFGSLHIDLQVNSQHLGRAENEQLERESCDSVSTINTTAVLYIIHFVYTTYFKTS